MVLADLFSIQRKIDDEKYGAEIVDRNDFRRKKFLNLLSKIGELVTLSKTSENGNSCLLPNHEELLPKFVDCLQSILSVGLEYNFTDVVVERDEARDYDLAQTFINIYIDVNELLIVASKDSYEELFKDFTTLGSLLNITKEEIYQKYLVYNSKFELKKIN